MVELSKSVPHPSPGLYTVCLALCRATCKTIPSIAMRPETLYLSARPMLCTIWMSKHSLTRTNHECAASYLHRPRCRRCYTHCTVRKGGVLATTTSHHTCYLSSFSNLHRITGKQHHNFLVQRHTEPTPRHPRFWRAALHANQHGAPLWLGPRRAASSMWREISTLWLAEFFLSSHGFNSSLGPTSITAVLPLPNFFAFLIIYLLQGTSKTCCCKMMAEPELCRGTSASTSWDHFISTLTFQSVDFSATHESSTSPSKMRNCSRFLKSSNLAGSITPRFFIFKRDSKFIEKCDLRWSIPARLSLSTLLHSPAFEHPRMHAISIFQLYVGMQTCPITGTTFKLPICFWIQWLGHCSSSSKAVGPSTGTRIGLGSDQLRWCSLPRHHWRLYWAPFHSCIQANQRRFC